MTHQIRGHTGAVKHKWLRSGTWSFCWENGRERVEWARLKILFLFFSFHMKLDLANFFSNSYEPGWKPVWANRSSVGHPQDASEFILRINVAQKYISNFKFMSQASSLWVFQTRIIFLTLDHHCCCYPPLLTFLHTPLTHWYASVGDLWATCSTVYIGYTSCQGWLSSHLQMSAVTDVCTLPHRLLTWHGSRPKGTKGLLEGSDVRVRVRWNQEGLQMSCEDLWPGPDSEK